MRRSGILCVVALCCFLTILVKGAHAADYAIKTLIVQEPWARASAGMARAGAAFMTIENMAETPDALVSAEADVSKVVELHTHVHDNGIMRMRQVDQIAVPEQGKVVLKPGGLHVMFIGLHKPLVEGQTFDVTLLFAKAGAIAIPVQVRGVGAR